MDASAVRDGIARPVHRHPRGVGFLKGAARIRQTEELTTPAAPGNGPGSTANGKSLGARIIARAGSPAKVDKPDPALVILFANKQ
jgi:hypothetical protein